MKENIFTLKENIFTDIVAAVKVTGEIRKARKAGADAIQIRPVRTIPCVSLPTGFLDVMEVFSAFPEKTRRDLAFTPENPGEWVERARFLQEQLKPVLPPKMYHTVMICFIGWYAKCLRRRLGVTV